MICVSIDTGLDHPPENRKRLIVYFSSVAEKENYVIEERKYCRQAEEKFYRAVTLEERNIERLGVYDARKSFYDKWKENKLPPENKIVA